MPVILINIINIRGELVGTMYGRLGMKLNHHNPKIKYQKCFTAWWSACSWALLVGLFTHFKFRACFHRRAGWKTFASLERSQMWWKIQVADIHLMHYAFHVLSRVAVSKSKWSKKKKKKKSDRDTEIEIYTFWFWNRQMPMLIKKENIYKKLLDFFFVWMLISE